MKTSQLFLGAAVAGLMGATSAWADGNTTAPSTGTSGAPTGLCKGANSCNNTSACGSMKGKNSCAGAGFLELTKADCDAKKLTWSPMPKAATKPAPKPAT